jgi:hypothetical protein
MSKIRPGLGTALAANRACCGWVLPVLLVRARRFEPARRAEAPVGSSLRDLESRPESGAEEKGVRDWEKRGGRRWGRRGRDRKAGVSV